VIVRALLIAVVISLTTHTAWAGEKIAVIEQFTGTVKVYKGVGKEAENVRKTGHALSSGDPIDTDKHHTQYVSRTLTGEGYGKTEKEAKKEALADLSSAIQSEVQSEPA